MSNIKEQIKSIIETDEFVNGVYGNDGCFKNIIVPLIMDCNDDELLSNLINIIAWKSQMYDNLINNIALYGSKELIDKCNVSLKEIINT